MGKSQIDASLELERGKGRARDKRVLVTVDAILKRLGFHLEPLWDQTFVQRSKFFVLTEYQTKSIAECMETVRAIDLFVLPSPELICEISLLPRSLHDLNEALMEYERQRNGKDLDFKKLERQHTLVSNSLSVVRLQVHSIRKKCQNMIELL